MGSLPSVPLFHQSRQLPWNLRTGSFARLRRVEPTKFSVHEHGLGQRQLSYVFLNSDGV